MTQQTDNSRRDFLMGALATVGAAVFAGAAGCIEEKGEPEKAPPCPPSKECPPEKPCVCPATPAATDAPKPAAPGDFKPWVGKIARTEINWGPTVDANKCIGCAVCMNCGPKVFEFIENKAVVKHYGKCMPGCTTCKNLCPSDAISFPDLQPVKDAFTKNRVYENMKGWLVEAGKLPKA